jgi:hypothetical protein
MKKKSSLDYQHQLIHRIANGRPFKRDWHAFVVLAALYLIARAIDPSSGV